VQEKGAAIIRTFSILIIKTNTSHEDIFPR
jgi:hypothetical protein